MKKIIAVLLVVCVLFTFSACGECEHDWVDATCEEDEYCSICGQVGDWATGHDWVEATCEESAYCSVCGATDGEPLGHDWVDATCTEAEYCEVCGEKGEKALGHNYSSYTGKCYRCSAEDPDFIDLENYGFYNMYGMTTWIEIDGRYLGEGYVMAEYDYRYLNSLDEIDKVDDYNPELTLRCYKDIYYSTYTLTAEQLASGLSRPTDSDYVKNYVYSILNNNSINSDRGSTTIFERIVVDDKLVLEVKDDGDEEWFVPIDLLDLSKTEPLYDKETNKICIKLYFK